MRIRGKHVAVSLAAAALVGAGGYAALSSVELGPARMDADAADMYEAQVFDEVVAFYDATCAPFADAAAAPEALSQAGEAAVLAGEDYDAAVVGAVGEVSGRITDAAGRLRAAEVPESTFDPTNRNPRQLGEVPGDVADLLDAAAAMGPAADPEQARARVDAAAESIGAALTAMTDAVPLPNTVTRDAVGEIDACDDLLFRAERIGDEVHVQAAYFHVMAAEASSIFDEGSARLRSEDPYESTDQIAAAWRARQDAATAAADMIAAWRAPAGEVYEGYPDARDTLVAAYRAAAEQAGQAAGSFYGADAAAAQTLMEAAAEGAVVPSREVVAASIRASRLAPIPNEATAAELDARIAE